MTKPMITMPSEDVLGSLVMAIEETALREHGWDRIPMLMTVQQIRSNVLDVWEAPIDATASNMLQLAGEISTADSEVSRLLRDDLVHCRTLAWVLLDTTVANMAMKGTDYLITKVQDHPESRETRFAFAMDLLGRTYVILRPRNQPARAADATSIAGNIPSALRIFNLAVARQLADNEDMIKGLMNLEVQTGLELDVAALHADPYVRFLSK